MPIESLSRWRLRLPYCLCVGMVGCTTPGVTYGPTVSESPPPVPAVRAAEAAEPDRPIRQVSATAESASDKPLEGENQTTDLPLDALPPLPHAIEDGETRAAAVTEPHPHGPAAVAVVPPPFLIDFPSALAIASGQNPQVSFAAARIHEAFAEYEGAAALWLPSIRTGLNYNKHEGRIQDVVGDNIDTSRGAFYTGLGAGAVGAGSPAVPGLFVNVHLADAFLQPEIASRVVAARQHAAVATTNDVLLETALAYLELLNALQQRAIALETLENTQELVTLTRDFAEAGQAPQADADRARAELAVRENLVARADEAVGVAVARLAQQLSVPPTVEMIPQEPAVVPITLVPAEAGVHDLVATGLSNRPELAENQQLVAEAVERLRREKYAPFLPSLLLGASYGGFGAGTGSNATGNFGDRFDFDAFAWWEVRNLGIGEKAARGQARARIDQARFRQVQLMDFVAREVAEAHTQVQARVRQIRTAEAGVEAALDSYRRNLDRIRDLEGLPLEVMQSIQALDLSRREYLRAVVEFNEAQFRLHRALGSPVVKGEW